jgi:hypothetical protein
LQDTTAHSATDASLESSPLWLDLSDWPGNYPKQCALLSLFVLVTDRPYASKPGPQMDPVGMFSDRGRVCVFVNDGKDHDQQRSDNGKFNSEEQH